MDPLVNLTPASQHFGKMKEWLGFDTELDSISGRLVAAAVGGLALHYLVFRKGEWHLQAPNILIVYLLSYPIVLTAEVLFGAGSFRCSALNAASILCCFTLAMFTSIITYRLFFHRLKSFPGPVGAKISKFWHVARCYNSQNHLVLENIRRDYGNFVRTGPSEITVFDPEALVKIDGPGSKVHKSCWYDFPLPDMGITTIRDIKLHDQRRRIWIQAFSSKAMACYEAQMMELAESLEKLVNASSKEKRPISFSSLAYWFSFDVMGMFALSEPFNMLHSEEWHYAISNLRQAMSLIGPLSPVPWLIQIGFRFLKGYWIVKKWQSMTGWCRERMEQRIKDNDNSVNVAAYLIAHSLKESSIERDRHLLAGDTISAVIAGSDTVAPTLVFLFYELARSPSQSEKLFEELQDIDTRDFKALEKLDHLNGLINETLRLHPAIPTAGYRDTPPEGITIGGHYIPGNTTIVAPRYSIFRSASCYERPDEFIPERWYSRPELVKDNRSFLPFSQGRYTCLGKKIALAELRIVAALLVKKYHISFENSDEVDSVEGDMKDLFTAEPGDLCLVFKPRDM